ncbi:MAG TPA: histone deacetylase family protein [Ilumatobacteraceae bacterium]|jgi:acetoin utilization deacetylase AcuC-like enzyme
MSNHPVSVITNDDHRSHDPEYDVYSGTMVGRFEVPQRVDCITHALDGGPFAFVDSTAHGMQPILRVHNPDLVDFLSTAWKDYMAILPDAQAVIAEMFIHPGLVEAMPIGRPPVTNAYGRLGWFCFDTSSPLSEGSWPAALSSVDIALSGVDRVLAGERIVYSLCRPPGHHATRSAFGGFCLLNNAAIAAQAFIDAGARRVTVLDVDAHHGNGTQQIFYERGDVQFVSIHMDPDQNYPWFVGRAHERGEGSGEGANLNLPLPLGTTGERFLADLSVGIDAVSAFDPEYVIVSLGVDPAEGDPTAGLCLTTPDFADVGALIATIDAPLLLVQEGGYQLNRLGDDVRAVLDGLCSAKTAV